MEKPDMKKLYYENDVRKHQQAVAVLMTAVAQAILDRGMRHDATKHGLNEADAYVDPVWQLNTGEVAYGSDEYKKLIAQMGEGLKHHYEYNDHHPEYFEKHSAQTLNDPIRCMDLFVLLEMCCDWIAASQRRNNDPMLAMDQLTKKYPIDEQLAVIIRNTVQMIKRLCSS